MRKKPDKQNTSFFSSEDNDSDIDDNIATTHRQIDDNVSFAFSDFFSNLYNALFVWETEEERVESKYNGEYATSSENKDEESLCSLTMDTFLPKTIKKGRNVTNRRKQKPRQKSKRIY